MRLPSSMPSEAESSAVCSLVMLAVSSPPVSVGGFDSMPPWERAEAVPLLSRVGMKRS